MTLTNAAALELTVIGFELPLLAAPGPQQRPVPTGADQTTTLRLIGQVTFPAPPGVTVNVRWPRQDDGGAVPAVA
jgi:hypothetical protein